LEVVEQLVEPRVEQLVERLVEQLVENLQLLAGELIREDERSHDQLDQVG